jgi:hypothetical protein
MLREDAGSMSQDAVEADLALDRGRDLEPLTLLGIKFPERRRGEM